MSSSHLLVSDEDPVLIEAYLDGAGALQLRHGADGLADHRQTLHVEHEDLDPPDPGAIRIEVGDFTSGGALWEITAEHADRAGGAVHWNRGAECCYCDFGPMSAPVEVTVTATDDSSPRQTRRRAITIRTGPGGGQRR